MYDLAPRFKKARNTGTPDNLAPNSYIICDGKDTLVNNVPFLSSAERKLALGQKLYTHTIYNPKLRNRIKGCASLQYRSKRLVYSKDDTPGPTHYDPKKPEKGCKYKPPPVHGKGRLYVCRVPYSLAASGPSVPTHIDENGYDVDSDGNLVKIPPNKHDRTRGPAFYKVPRGELCFTTRRYHQGCQWSKSKSKRKSLLVSDTPPPNAYDPKPYQRTTNERDERYREMARLFSFAPRYTEGQMLSTAREDLPGPASYNLNTSSIPCKKSLSINPRPFIAGTKRFGSAIVSETPAPGTYEICDCPTEHKQFSIKNVPFGFQSDRFSKKNVQNFPGPNTYSIKGAIEEKISSKINKYLTVNPPFNQTAERKIGFVSEEVGFLPGPGDYDVEEKEVEKQAVAACCFKSRTKRFRNLGKSEDAGPASYSVSEQFNKNRNRTSHNTGKVPFHSSQSRLPGRKTKTPGPADYLGQEQMRGKGTSFNITPRFKRMIDDGMPEPGSYTLHPSVGLSTYKAVVTHNLRLKENVMRTKLRHPPGETWQNWVSETKKKKKLRWFSKPTIDYRHCIVVT